MIAILTLPTVAAHALSVDAELAERLRPGSGRVHSAFAHVINILAWDEQLIALCARGLDDAPWSMRVDLPHWTSWRLATGDTVDLSATAIRFSGQCPAKIKLSSAVRWYTNLVPIDLSSGELRRRSRALGSLLDAHGVAGGMRTSRGPVTVFDAEIGCRLRSAQAALAAGIRDGRLPAVTAAVTDLVGLGPGLTPAGDDFLTGLVLLAAQPGSRLSGVVPAVQGVLDIRPDRTTLLSRTTLREALRGRARQCLLDLLHRLLVPAGQADGPLEEHLRIPVGRVLTIGHTSGTDILSGLLAGLRLEEELRGSV